MSSLFYLAAHRLRHAKKQSLILGFCLTLVFFLPLASSLVTHGFESKYRDRAERVPLVLGARGNRFDLTLAVLSHRDLGLPTIPRREADAITRDGTAYAIPILRRFRAQGHPIVATTPDLYAMFGIEVASGSKPQQLGDCVVGARVAASLGLEVGSRIFSDPIELYDLSKPPALRMLVVGVLAANGSADDDAVFVDIKTGWLLEGLFHGHQEDRKVDPELVMTEVDGHRTLSKALVEFHEVTDANRDSFHVHGDPGDLPLSAIVVVPRDDKARTILSSRVNRSRLWQMLEPSRVVDELMDYVLGIKRLVDGLSVLLGVSTALLIGLVLSLSVRLRASETLSLSRIGVARATIVKLWILELGLIVAGAAVLAGLLAWLFVLWAPAWFALS